LRITVGRRIATPGGTSSHSGSVRPRYGIATLMKAGFISRAAAVKQAFPWPDLRHHIAYTTHRLLNQRSR
jgi:hypothetical protein